MNIYKALTEYTSDGKIYPSEIFIPGHMTGLNIMKERCLPNEQIVSDPQMASNNTEWVKSLKLNKECVAHYVLESKYVDATHRLMYLVLIKGQNNVDLFEFMKDDGLMHELLHLKTNYSNANISDLANQANAFELTVPGTFLWALAQIKP